MASEMIEKAVDIVRKMVEKGMSVDQIKEKLASVNMSEADIVEILEKAGVKEAPAKSKEEAPKEGAQEAPAEEAPEQAAPEGAVPSPVEEKVAEPPPLQPEAQPAQEASPKAVPEQEPVEAVAPAADLGGPLMDEIIEIKSIVSANRTLTKDLLDTTREVLMRLEQMNSVTKNQTTESSELSSPMSTESSDSLLTEDSDAEVQKMLMKDLEKKTV